MTSHYKFTCTEYDEETGSEKVVTVEINPQHDAWSGFDGPVYEFFNFLKGCGFIFENNAQLGILETKGNNAGTLKFSSSIQEASFKAKYEVIS